MTVPRMISPSLAFSCSRLSANSAAKSSSLWLPASTICKTVSSESICIPPPKGVRLMQAERGTGRPDLCQLQTLEPYWFAGHLARPLPDYAFHLGNDLVQRHR